MGIASPLYLKRPTLKRAAGTAISGWPSRGRQPRTKRRSQTKTFASSPLQRKANANLDGRRTGATSPFSPNAQKVDKKKTTRKKNEPRKFGFCLWKEGRPSVLPRRRRVSKATPGSQT